MTTRRPEPIRTCVGCRLTGGKRELLGWARGPGGKAIPRRRASGGKAVPGVKPKAATVEPLPERRPEPKKRREEATAPEPDEAASGDGKVADQAVAAEAEARPEGAGLPVLKVTRGASAQDIADKTGRSAAEIIKALLAMGEMVTSATQSLSEETIGLLAAEFGFEPQIVAVEEEEEAEEEVDESRLAPRPPVVTV